MYKKYSFSKRNYKWNSDEVNFKEKATKIAIVFYFDTFSKVVIFLDFSFKLGIKFNLNSRYLNPLSYWPQLNFKNKTPLICHRIYLKFYDIILITIMTNDFLCFHFRLSTVNNLKLSTNGYRLIAQKWMTFICLDITWLQLKKQNENHKNIFLQHLGCIIDLRYKVSLFLMSSAKIRLIKYYVCTLADQNYSWIVWLYISQLMKQCRNSSEFNMCVLNFNFPLTVWMQNAWFKFFTCNFMFVSKMFIILKEKLLAIYIQMNTWERQKVDSSFFTPNVKLKRKGCNNIFHSF